MHVRGFEVNMRSTLLFVALVSLLNVMGCRTENCPTGMERLEDGVCHDLKDVDSVDTGAPLDTGISGDDDEE